jgi:hypothetical protein
LLLTKPLKSWQAWMLVSRSAMSNTLLGAAAAMAAVLAAAGAVLLAAGAFSASSCLPQALSDSARLTASAMGFIYGLVMEFPL